MGIEWDLRILTDLLEGFLVALLVPLILLPASSLSPTQLRFYTLNSISDGKPWVLDARVSLKTSNLELKFSLEMD